MQIRLSTSNTEKLKKLQGIYRKTCPGYNLSGTQQANLLLAGRFDVAIKEAKDDLERSKNDKC